MLQRQVLNALYPDGAMDRDILLLHEIVIRSVRPLPRAIPGVLEAFGLMPMARRHVMHAARPGSNMRVNDCAASFSAKSTRRRNARIRALADTLSAGM